MDKFEIILIKCAGVSNINFLLFLEIMFYVCKTISPMLLRNLKSTN